MSWAHRTRRIQDSCGSKGSRARLGRANRLEGGGGREQNLLFGLHRRAEDAARCGVRTERTDVRGRFIAQYAAKWWEGLCPVHFPPSWRVMMKRCPQASTPGRPGQGRRARARAQQENRAFWAGLGCWALGTRRHHTGILKPSVARDGEWGERESSQARVPAMRDD